MRTAQTSNEVRFLNPPSVDLRRKKYCRFKKAGRVYYVGASDDPEHPLGFYQHGEAWCWEFHAPGSRVAFSSLSPALQKVVMDEYNELWGIT